MNRDEMQLRIVKSLALNRPVINSAGAAFSKLLVLKVPPNGLYSAIDCLDHRGVCVLEGSLERIGVELASDRYHLYLFPLIQMSRKTENALDFLYSAASSGTVNGKKFRALIVVVTELLDITDPDDHMFIVSIDDEQPAMVPDDELHPLDGEIDLVLELVRKQSAQENRDASALVAACCFIFPRLCDKTAFADYIETARQMAEENVCWHDSKGLSRVFISKIMQSLSREELVAYELPFLEGQALHDLKSQVFYDEEHLFISESRTKSMIRSIGTAIGTDAFKNALRRDGILIPEPGNTRSFVTNMRYWVAAGLPLRAPMLRFNIHAFTSESGLEFRDQLQLIYQRRKHND